MTRDSDFHFTIRDGKLFDIEDRRLCAEALQASVVPKLKILLGQAISEIKRVYDVDPLEDSIVSFFPHFRPKRENDSFERYEWAFAGLGGKRTKNKWFGFSRQDGREVQILPFRLGFTFDRRGLGLDMHHNWLKGLDKKSYDKILYFYIQNTEYIQKILFHINAYPQMFSSKKCLPLTPMRDMYRTMMKENVRECDFYTESMPTPTSKTEHDIAIERFVTTYPIYDSLIRIARGERHQFARLVACTNTYLVEQEGQIEDEALEDESTPHKQTKASILYAEKRLKVPSGLRYRVFCRDGWRCQSCGLISRHGAILHVDHIIPRSKGGGSDMENLQTLCVACNLGKSNRDQTDLRASPSRPK